MRRAFLQVPVLRWTAALVLLLFASSGFAEVKVQADERQIVWFVITDDQSQYTMPTVFNRSGYDTMRTCKRGNRYEAANELFTVRHDAMKRSGADETGSAWHAERVPEYLADRQSDRSRMTGCS